MKKASDLLSQCLEWADHLGQKGQVRFIVDSGTLLGMVREGRVLPGDPDIDLTIASNSDMTPLLAGLADMSCRKWCFDDKIYKIQIFPGRNGPPMKIDIKIFNNPDGEWICPAIGVHQSMECGTERKRKLLQHIRSLLRPFWVHLVARDASRAPLRWITRRDAWVVPFKYFANVVEVPGYRACVMPQDWDGYLSYRYGQWRIPVRNWVPSRDDGGYRRYSLEYVSYPSESQNNIRKSSLTNSSPVNPSNISSI